MKQWALRGDLPAEISKELDGWPELVRRLLFYRGIETKEAAEKFLNPDYERDIHDPFSALGMEKAAERILRAADKNERVVVFGDYDADGVCSSVILHEFFKKIGFENFHIRIPDRNLDGYGLSSEAVDEFIGQKAKLIITLDCGITDYQEVEKANAAGIDVVIIDHHLVPVSESGEERAPNAYAVVDAKQKEDPYPFKFLAGAGAAFKTVQALVKKGTASGQIKVVPGWEKWLLDLAAIATVADMVPLIDENRSLSHFGLKVLKKTRRAGLLSFFRRMRMSPADVSEDDITFMIAPRINIASRMDHANISFELLTTESEEEADCLSGRLEEMNAGRKKAVEEILDEVEENVAKTGAVPDLIAEGNLDWHPGVLGIAANRLLDKYERPIFLWGKAEAKQIKGSCRGGEALNLVDFMKSLPDGILIESGGHAKAGGFAVNEEKIGEFKTALLKTYEKTPKPERGESVLDIDGELDIDAVNWDTYGMIEKLGPFGMDNPKPVFSFSGLEIAAVRKFGNGEIHLGLDFKNSSGKKVSAIGFFMGNEDWLDLKAGSKIDLAASLEKSFFAGRTELRLKIVDIKASV